MTSESTETPTGAFDGAARSYDRDFSRTALGRRLRDWVWQEVEPVIKSGDRVLELGCGTGEDTVRLARRGIRVRATDISPAMLEVTREKVAAAGVNALVETGRLDVARLAQVTSDSSGPFDGVLSNFGALNCIGDRTGVARALAGLVRPGGVVVTVIMGPFCPWEMVWHLYHLEPLTAIRRWRQGRSVHVGGGVSIPVWYPTPARVRREFADGFRQEGLVAIGCFLPPPYLAHLEENRPGLIRRLDGLEGRWRGTFPFTWCGDHFLQIFRRTDEPVESTVQR
jgi:ubiquinone/menaquinone biosynthesis C-methylase UbiE